MKGFLICLSVRTRVAQGNFDGFFLHVVKLGMQDFPSQLTISPFIPISLDRKLAGCRRLIFSSWALASLSSAVQLLPLNAAVSSWWSLVGRRQLEPWVRSSLRRGGWMRRKHVSFRSAYLSYLVLAEPYLRCHILNHFDVVQVCKCCSVTWGARQILAILPWSRLMESGLWRWNAAFMSLFVSLQVLHRDVYSHSLPFAVMMPYPLVRD